MNIIRPISISNMVLTGSSLGETDYAAWASGTTYALAARVVVLATHSVYESVQAGNLNHAPNTDDGTWWVRVGATNKWRAFDRVIGDPATSASTITYELTMPSLVNAIAFFGLTGAELHVTVTDGTDGLVYDRTVPLLNNEGVVSWYAYFFEPVIQLDEVLLSDLPAYSSATIDISITPTGGVAAAGEVVPGATQPLGVTVYGTEIGITDYSRKERDAFGNPYVVERAYAKLVDFDFMVDTPKAATVAKTLAQYRASPVVFYGAVDVSFGTTVYGYYREFRINLANPAVSYGSMLVEGLV